MGVGSDNGAAQVTPSFSADDHRWMAEALALADAAEANGEVPVGAVVVRGDEIVGRGRNAPLATQDPSAHAELLAVRDAAVRLGNYRLTDCRVYVTLEPCLMCVGAMVHARVAEVVFAAPDPKSGALGGITDALTLPGLNHRFAVRSGLMADIAGERLRQFFRNKRRAT
ncbi:MAG: tRNA adenosine(34) deaminase TadA [Pseudomonadota bacterium]